MVEAGLDVARLNFSHGTHEVHQENLDRVRNASGRAGRPVAILQDLPGPKIRIGPLKDEYAELAAGSQLTLVCDGEVEGDARHMSISWTGLPQNVEDGDVVYLADGAIRLRVTASRAAEKEVDTRVEVG